MMGNQLPEGYVGLCVNTACCGERHNQTGYCKECLDRGERIKAEARRKAEAQGQMVTGTDRDAIARAIWHRHAANRITDWSEEHDKELYLSMADAALSAITLTPHAEAKREGMLEAAQFCEAHTMDVVTNPEKAMFAGVYVAGEPSSNSKHAGNGYADAIRAEADEIKSGVSVDILPMRLSGSGTEHWVRISCSGRTFDVRNYPDHLLNRALYERDSLRHVLLGHPKPDLMADKYADPKESK